jgi:pilus assembly protein Flp/PilA
MKFFKLMNRFNREEDGATAIEYGLMVALIAVALITIVTTLGTDVGATFTAISTALTGA